jgi:excisionase family DNA binding protein
MAKARVERWLSLGEAASRLGVDEATLRHWCDTGRVKTFRTPGGHRRFREDDLKTLIQRDAPRVENLAEVVERRSARVLAGEPAKALHDRPWFSSLDDALRAKARLHGREMFASVVRYVADPAVRKGLRDQLLDEADRYGQELGTAGVTATDAAEALAHFRHIVLGLVTKPRGRGGLLDEDQVRTLLDVSDLLDAVFLTMVRAIDAAAASHAAEHAPRSRGLPPRPDGRIQ